jgi:hypothetical protein
LLLGLPQFERRLNQGIPGFKMPVEAALGDSQAFGNHLDGDILQTAFGQGIQCSLFPIE